MKKSAFVHHVFFWLKNADSQKDLAQLIEGLRKLESISVMRSCHIGTPAPTNRSVIDSSYSVSLLTLFDNGEDEKIYQEHPVHKEFIASCSHLWERVLIYDSIDI